MFSKASSDCTPQPRFSAPITANNEVSSIINSPSQPVKMSENKDISLYPPERLPFAAVTISGFIFLS